MPVKRAAATAVGAVRGSELQRRGKRRDASDASGGDDDEVAQRRHAPAATTTAAPRRTQAAAASTAADARSSRSSSGGGKSSSSSKRSTSAGASAASSSSSSSSAVAASAGPVPAPAAVPAVERTSDGLTGPDSDSDDYEGPRNRIGNVPFHWYKDNFDHIGYDIKGAPVVPKRKTDALEQLVARSDDPNFYRTVIDERNDVERTLTDAELELLGAMQTNRFIPGFDETEELGEIYSRDERMFKFPLGEAVPPRKRFIPSKTEARIIARMARNILAERARAKEAPPPPPDVYDLWSTPIEGPVAPTRRLLPPRSLRPSHAESYNPPDEYIPSEEEKARWLAKDATDRPYNFVPRKHSVLRAVPGYERFVHERFERMLDLFLCAREEKQRLQIDPDSLLPYVPQPSELRPYPELHSIVFKGHSARVTSVDVSSDGRWVASSSFDGTVRVWEVDTGRCAHVAQLGGEVACVRWCPSASVHVLAAAVETKVVLLDFGVDPSTQALSRSMLALRGGDNGSTVPWQAGSDGSGAIRVVLPHRNTVRWIAWHAKGDYLASISPDSGESTVLVHQMSTQRSQAPFKRSLGRVTCVSFHPKQPYLLVSTQHYVRIYHLVEGRLVKKLQPGSRQISAIAVHPSGDHVLVSTVDCKLHWFDLDLGDRPYKTFQYHKKAVRAVAFHPTLPLFASAGDDTHIHVLHGSVPQDLAENPTIVPLCQLLGHNTNEYMGVTDVVFHPTQPWLLSAGADHTLRLYVERY